MMGRNPWTMHFIYSRTILGLKRLRCSCKMSGIYLKWSQTQSYSDDSNNSSEENCHTSYLEKRRKALFGQRRQLSPFERVSGMVAQDKEDMLLGKQKQEVDPVCDQSRQSRVSLVENLSSESSINKNNLEKHTVHEEMRDIHLATKKTGILIDGEYIYVMMENIKTNTHLQEIFLLEAGRKFQCRYGSLNHTEIVGHLPGKIFLTDKGYPVLVRRPTLKEYVLHMKRTATISYPKVVCNFEISQLCSLKILQYICIHVVKFVMI